MKTTIVLNVPRNYEKKYKKMIENSELFECQLAKPSKIKNVALKFNKIDCIVFGALAFMLMYAIYKQF